MIGTILFNLFIEPLEILFEFVFSVTHRLFGSPLLVLISVSIVVNLVALPLYNRADAIQQEENERQQKMARWVDHIKKTFKGDERYMMISTYYRQQGYKTYYSLRSSISLILQIPFFIAAYDYLSNLEILQTMKFWVFTNLGAPDGLIKIGDLSINAMPIIMTLINVVASYIYLKGATRMQKIQTYALAAFFLVFLYTSPSGLVIYWTFNQVFSLFKNIFTKLIKSRVILGAFISLIGVAVFLGVLLTGHADTRKKLVLMIVILIVCQIPLIIALIKKRKNYRAPRELKPVQTRVFVLTGVFLTIFAGVIIPLSVVSSSPAEFMVYGNTPGNIVLNTACIMAGVFIIWFGVYYYLGTTRMRTIFSYILFAIAGVAVVDFFFFGRNLGTMSEMLVFDAGFYFPMEMVLINLLVVAAAIAVCILAMKFLKKAMPYILIVLIVAAIGLSITQTRTTAAELEAANLVSNKIKTSEAEKVFEFSKTGKNVLVIMLDRAVGAYIPHIFKEKPELKKQFAGFTFYPNTLSYGKHTNFGIPALYGGYEYAPWAMNERSGEKLVDKHDEALLVMPTLFSENGYKVQITDPAYAGYKTPSDLSIYDGLKNTSVSLTIGHYEIDDPEIDDYYKATSHSQNRNFVFYSILKSVPLALQGAVYDSGGYYSTDPTYTTNVFLDNYAVLDALPKMTGTTDKEENTFIFLENEAPHSPTILEWDSYKPGSMTEDEALSRKGKYVIDGIEMKMDTMYRVTHYMCNMATCIKLGEWFDVLRKEGIWDNTRVIVAADHGVTTNGNGQFSNMMINKAVDAQAYNPLLMVKDFNSKEFTVSDEFMTNADVVTLACDGLIDDPVNPFTGKAINSDPKNAEPQIITTSWHYRPKADHPTGTVFNTEDGQWWSVHDNIFDKDNWEFVADGD